MNHPDQNIQKKAQGSQQATLQSLETKLDKILDYQKGAYHWAIVRSVFNFLIFMALVVLPIVGGYYLYRSIATQVDFSKLSSQYGQITQGLDNLKNLQREAGKTLDLKAILNSIKLQ